MKSKQTTSDRAASQARGAMCQTGISSHAQVFLLAIILIGFSLTLSGCKDSPVAANSNDIDPIPAVDPQSLTETTIDQKPGEEKPVGEQPGEKKPRRLKRGEVPEEWIEPQRERAMPIDRTGDKLDLTFDDLKFDIEIGQAFERELLSEEVKTLDGKEITLSGYMRPSFKSTGIKGFIFVRDDKECCFGPQAAIYDCVRVKLK